VPGIRDNELEMIKTETEGAILSMTSVHKPLKFITPLHKKLVETYNKHPDGDEFKLQLGDRHGRC